MISHFIAYIQHWRRGKYISCSEEELIARQIAAQREATLLYIDSFKPPKDQVHRSE